MGSEGRSRSRAASFSRDDYQFACRSQPLEGRLYFSGCHADRRRDDPEKTKEVTCSVYLWISFSRGAGDAIPDTNKTSVVEASPFNVRLGALPEKTGSSSP